MGATVTAARRVSHGGRGRAARRVFVFCLLSFAFFLPRSAFADLVFFQNGQSLSVKSHRVDGDRLVLALRTGGEITCARATIARIEADEVPYPEPAPVIADAAPVLDAGAAIAPAALAPMIETLASRHGVDARIVRAVVQVESSYRSTARSPRGALGLMQLMPATARQYSVQNPFDPHANLDAGIRHLRSLLDRFDLSLALAAYNAGEATIKRYGGVPPFRETREYVQRVMQLIDPAAR